MMKERKVLFNLTSLMIAILGMLFMFAQTATAYEKFGDGCIDCHGDFYDKEHDMHKNIVNNDCNRCHVQNGDYPLASNCAECHPRDGYAGVQELVNLHDCATCHASTPSDVDDDGITDNADNCLDTFNAEQLDADSDSIGDVCDDTPGCGGCGDPVCEKSLIDKVEELLTHYYLNILNRAPDSGGLTYWTDEIITLVSSGGDIKEGFISMAQAYFYSQEYLDKDRNDEEFVTDLYNTFFNRPPDLGGLNYWTDNLAQGMSRNEALDSFVYSAEFNAFMNNLFGIS
jgi:hypothetical protein